MRDASQTLAVRDAKEFAKASASDGGSVSVTKGLEMALQELENISPRALGLSEDSDLEKGCLSCS